MAFQLFKTQIEFIHGAYTEPPADGLIIPANDHLWMGTGPARLIKEAGGEEIEREAVKEGPVGMGDVVVTAAGKLPFKHILHAALMSQDLHISAETLGLALQNAIQRAAKLKLKHINFAVPLETGDRPLRPDILAEMIRVLFRVLEEIEGIKTLRLVVANESSKKIMHDAFLHALY
ncbi:MAG: macro domain-containing protein [Candidatus Eisenbacteria bacterium]|uniref:Macro domain-containing protein n=1 Tax=Eiseniibacteriota bacterium TaxID=2212470 RepID=A0A948RW97_UNCEI|nr:macro domain-containing protein [Candidatus Eisenbacteria bacterium]MBU1949092.1 macro domain-containing protein [Candidatus Eisenbacteria bacterium]MBU2691656.1 macro domain-containing protein [Candidatus Eisenbacteria bacterium]